MNEKKIYSNPRTFAEFPDWPMGSNKRGIAQFAIEQGKGKERAIRQTCLNGHWSNPKKLTYAQKARIVDGSDGRTYILEQTATHFSVMRGDMKFQEESVFEDDARYEGLKALFS